MMPVKVRTGFNVLITSVLLAVSGLGIFEAEYSFAQDQPTEQVRQTSNVEAAIAELIAELNPPTVEEIIALLQPIPTLEEILAPLPDDPNAQYRRVLTDEDKTKVEELEKRITELREQGKYAEAVSPAEEVAAIRVRVQGKDHWETADARREVETVTHIATLPAEAQTELAQTDRDTQQVEQLYAQGKYNEALLLAQRQVVVRRRLLGDEHSDVASSLNDLAVLLEAQGKLIEANPMLRESLAMRRKLLGDEHPDVAANLNSLGLLLQAQGRLTETEPLFREALAIRRKLLGDEHPDVATGLNDFGLLLQHQGKLAEAEQLLCESLARHRRLPSDEHSDIATNLNSLARLLWVQGKLAEAETLLRESLAMRRKRLGDEHPNVASSLNNLGLLLQDQGKLVEAEQLLRESLARRRKQMGNKHPIVATSLNNLGLLLLDQGKPSKAEPLLRESLAMYRRLLGDEHPAVAISLNNLARLLWGQGKLAEAEPLLLESLAMCRKLLGNKHPLVAINLGNLGLLLQDQGKLAEAERLFHESLAMSRKLFGNEHTNVTAILNNLAMLLNDQGKFSEAEEHWTLAADSFEAARLLASFTGMERVEFADRRSPLQPLAACLARNGKPHPAWERLESNLARGLFDEVFARQVRPLSIAERNREGDLLRHLAKFDEHILALAGSKDATEENRNRLKELHTRQEALQTQFVRFEKELEDKYGPAAGQTYGLKKIQKSLSAETALLAWIDIKGRPKAFDPNGEHWACVVRHQGEPVWVKLSGNGDGGAWTEEDDKLPQRLRKALSTRQSASRDPQSEIAALYRQRIVPVESHLNGVCHLIVLPAGWMAGVPIEVLTDQYTVSYAPSGTMYAWLKEESEKAEQRQGTKPAETLLALGDPVFKKRSEPPDHGVLITKVDLESNAALQTTRGESFAPLPGTRYEVEAIAKLFGENQREGSATVLLGSDTSEQKLTALATSGKLREFGFLHFATHGIMDDKVAMRSALILSQDRLPDPLEAIIAGSEVCDGRLTAQQIARTWKLDAELVTLSACQTALGKVSGGEGYLGFSQALFVTGARSLVLSLWKVDDGATTVLMTRFYENLLGRYSEPRGRYAAGTAIPKAEALSEAKRWLRSLPASEAKALGVNVRGGLGTSKVELIESDSEPDFSHPYFWAGFILIGDPN